MKFDIDKSWRRQEARIIMRKLFTRLSPTMLVAACLIFIYSYSQIIALAMGWYYTVVL